MGRRALRPLAKKIDISQHYLTDEDLPNPWNPDAIFGDQAPLEVEVGSGKGLFITNAAARNPEHHFLGIEVAKKYAKYAASKLSEQELNNACMVGGDALAVFHDLIPDNSLEAVHVYFPDPWWKTRHRKRRVLREPLMKDIQRTLKPGRMLHFWTDVEEYYLSSLKLFAKHTTLQGPNLIEEKDSQDDMDYLTHFERKTRRGERPVYRCNYVK